MIFNGKKLTVGTSWSDTYNNSNYPASEYSLQIVFYKNQENKFVITGVPSGDSHLFNVTPQQTNHEHGTYIYQVFAISLTERHLVEQGQVQLYPNLLATEDPRGEWTIRYESLKNAYDQICKTPMASVTIDNRSYTYSNRNELLAQLNYAKDKMDDENGVRRESKIFKARFR